jgi:hypothetical protein
MIKGSMTGMQLRAVRVVLEYIENPTSTLL